MKLRLFIPALAGTLGFIDGAAALDAALPDYQVTEGVSGQLKSVGSDTLSNEMAAWAKGFNTKYPGVTFEIESQGSATAPAALIAGLSEFAPMSRPMTSAESGAFEKKFGYRPGHFRVAVDAVAIYVNKDNPIKCLSETQLDRIFSATRKGGGGRNIATWGDVGLTGEWATKPITPYGRNSLSGTYEFFRAQVLYGGDFKPEVKQQSTAAAIVEGVARDRFAIGYSGLGARTEGVRALQVAVNEDSPCYDTSAQVVLTGKYPIARYLQVYVNKKPDEPLEPLRAEFIKYVLSREGQTLTEKGGYYPITGAERQVDLNALGIEAQTR